MLSLALLVLTARAAVPTPVPALDLQRYAGTWYEIARFPNRFQKQCVGDVTADYRVLDPRDVAVVNRCRTAEGRFDQADGRARRPDPTAPAQLQVRFAPAWLSWLPFVWGDYWVIDLADDYHLAVVGGASRDYLWVLARTPQLDDREYAAVRERIAAQGYDLRRLTRTPQSVPPP